MCHYSSQPRPPAACRRPPSWILPVTPQLPVDQGMATLLTSGFVDIDLVLFRCTTRINGADDLNGRHSSSADEGFTSGSSPVNGLGVPPVGVVGGAGGMPIILSPQSSDTQDTAHLVSSSAASSSSTSSSASSDGLGGSTSKQSQSGCGSVTKPPLIDCLTRESTVWDLFMICCWPKWRLE